MESFVPIKNSSKLVLLAHIQTPDVISVIINISVGNSYLSAPSAVVDLGQVKGAYSTTAGKSINANEAHKKERVVMALQAAQNSSFVVVV